ncbi:MAG: DUF1492 domain-containing protein [Lachnospiraceae bacterium]|nr:DUF1492 domain-containing protein [Lachnospiraceae bacterium]
MTAKEYLNRAYKINRRVTAKMKRLEALKDMVTRMNATLSDMPGSPNMDRSELEEIMAKIVDLENDTCSEIDRLVTVMKEVMNAINSVEDANCQIVLEYRYLCFRSWEDIADELGCSMRNVYILHSKALESVKIPT